LKKRVPRLLKNSGVINLIEEDVLPKARVQEAEASFLAKEKVHLPELEPARTRLHLPARRGVIARPQSFVARELAVPELSGNFGV